MILKTAEDTNSCARQLFFTSAARVAWRHLLNAINLEPTQSVLMPSYIGFTEREGSGVFDPIEETGVAFQFYKVDRTLRVNIQDFEEIIAQGNIRVALVIHYFGFCRNDMAYLAKLCKDNNVLLVEDCAHAFQVGLPNQKLGTGADFSFYAMHKFIATASGGILQSNTDSIEIPPIDPKDAVEVSVLEQCIKTDIVEVSRVRRANYALYEQHLSNQKGVELMYPLEIDDIPHNFPLLIGNGDREKLYFYLADKGITTIALYYRMIEQITKEEFPISFQVSGDILNLPVHQDTTEEDIIKICKAIKSFYAEFN